MLAQTQENTMVTARALIVRSLRYNYRCEGQSMCAVQASNDNFFDSCPATHKYLNVEYFCVDEEGRHVDTGGKPLGTLHIACLPLSRFESVLVL